MSKASPSTNESDDASQQTGKPNHISSLPSRTTHSAVPSRLPIPEEFQKSPDPHTTTGCSPLSSSLPSRSESSNALNGNAASPPSTLTGCTSVTSVPSKENLPYAQLCDFVERRTRGQGTMGANLPLHPQRSLEHMTPREHMFIHEVSG
jgi:hypothetical protein